MQQPWAHECAHIARRDFAKNLIYECVAATIAYHPACRLMRRRIAETRELMCDEMAAGAVGDRPEYAASLLRLATAMAAPAARASHAIGVFDANILEERIMRLTTDVPKVTRTRRIAMAAVTTGALMGGAATTMALSFDVTSQNGAATAPAHGKIYKIGGDVTPPVLTHAVDAVYPQSERSKGKSNVVVVCELVVNSRGLPEDVHVVRSAGGDFDKRDGCDPAVSLLAGDTQGRAGGGVDHDRNQHAPLLADQAGSCAALRDRPAKRWGRRCTLALREVEACGMRRNAGRGRTRS